MALSSRSGFRFFSAFYRWNQQAHLDSPCSLDRSSCTNLGRRLRSRPFATTAARLLPSKRAHAQAAVPGTHNRKDRVSKNVDDKPPKDEVERSQESEHEQKLPSVGWRSSLDVLSSVTSFTGNDGPSALRDIMRFTPQSVVIVTAGTAQGAYPSQPLGLAVSSFSTISLDPPTISFNIKLPSRTLDAIEANDGKILVHFLRNSQKAATLAHLFTTDNTEKSLKARTEAISELQEVLDANSLEGPIGLKARHSAVVAILQCKLKQTIPVADHAILVAEVDAVEMDRKHQVPLLMYSQGQFLNTAKSQPLRPLTIDNDRRMSHVLWHKPIALENYDLAKIRYRILKAVKQMPALFELPLETARQRLCRAEGIDIYPLGIRLESIILEAARDAGYHMQHDPIELELPKFPQFSVPLSEHDHDVAVKKALALIRKDRRYLALHHEHFFSLVGINPYGPGNIILASEIMEPLRAEGLVPPLEPSTSPSVAKFVFTKPAITLEMFEQLEASMRSSMSRCSPEEAARAPLVTIFPCFGRALDLAARIRQRISMQTHPELYNPSLFKFTGHLTVAESRMACLRILAQANLPNPTATKEFFKTNISAFPMLCGIHPFTTGPNFDMYSLFLKLQYWFNTLPFLTYRQKLLSTRHALKNPRMDLGTWENRCDRLVEWNMLQLPHWTEDEIRDAQGISNNFKVFSKEAGDYESGVGDATLEWPMIVRALIRSGQARYERFSDEEKAALDAFRQKWHESGVDLHAETTTSS